jgi:hypothetical protein
MKTAAQVRKHIEALPEGALITSHELSVLGPRASVDQAVSRLVRSGHISRVTRGVFVKPKENRYVRGLVPPEPSMVAEAVARATGAEIQINGAEAARRFGFSTQVPMRHIFQTTGASRKLRIGAMPLELRRTSPRKLALAGRPAGEALSALWYLGKGQVGAGTVAQLRSRLPPEEFEALTGAVNAMPGWMAEAFRQYGKQSKDAGINSATAAI